MKELLVHLRCGPAIDDAPGAPRATVMSTWILGLALFGVVAAAPTPTHHVRVTVDKHTDFAALHTYAWTPGWGAFNQDLDTHIVAAIDRELTSLGLTRLAGAPSDMLVTYGTVRRTNVDVSAKRKGKPVYPEYPVGTLVVLLRESLGHREVFRARAELRVDIDTAQLGEQIDAIVARMFARYPTRT
jgi:hypothetical protein